MLSVRSSVRIRILFIAVISSRCEGISLSGWTSIEFLRVVFRTTDKLALPSSGMDKIPRIFVLFFVAVKRQMRPGSYMDIGEHRYRSIFLGEYASEKSFFSIRELVIILPLLTWLYNFTPGARSVPCIFGYLVALLIVLRAYILISSILNHSRPSA